MYFYTFESSIHNYRLVKILVNEVPLNYYVHIHGVSGLSIQTENMNYGPQNKNKITQTLCLGDIHT